jgi:Spy/CpxP family protein refolding chaperone
MQQKHEKIREIRQHAQEEIKTLITPQQQEALRACQQERSSEGHLGSGGNRNAGVGPCGETPTAKTPSP